MVLITNFTIFTLLLGTVIFSRLTSFIQKFGINTRSCGFPRLYKGYHRVDIFLKFTQKIIHLFWTELNENWKNYKINLIYTTFLSLDGQRGFRPTSLFFASGIFSSPIIIASSKLKKISFKQNKECKRKSTIHYICNNQFTFDYL